jgi:hypothetical protein
VGVRQQLRSLARARLDRRTRATLRPALPALAARFSPADPPHLLAGARHHGAFGALAVSVEQMVFVGLDGRVVALALEAHDVGADAVDGPLGASVVVAAAGHVERFDDVGDFPTAVELAAAIAGDGPVAAVDDGPVHPR